MRKYIFIIFSAFLFACKEKEIITPLAKVNQFPKSITFLDVDVHSNIESLIFKINYFYNDSNRIDSVIIMTNTDKYIDKFNYSQFASNSTILLNYTNTSLPYSVLNYDGVYFNLNAYRNINGLVTTVRAFQYDSINRLQRFSFDNNSTNDFVLTQTYKRDTVFAHIILPFSSCSSTDTMLNTTIEMSKTLPYLLLTKSYNSCTTIINADIFTALPLSSFSNKLPKKIINNNTQVDYIHSFDVSNRLTETDINTKNRATNVITLKNKILIAY
jgi:hypothetical protein